LVIPVQYPRKKKRETVGVMVSVGVGMLDTTSLLPLLLLLIKALLFATPGVEPAKENVAGGQRQ
jgi:hypothetical protein